MDYHSKVDTLVERLRKRETRSTDAPTPELPPTEGPDDLGPWGWLRGMRERSPMLELRFRDGNVVAVSYAYLERATFDPSVGITLHLAGGKQVLIKGRRLNDELRPQVRLFEGIVRHRVAWLREGELTAGSGKLPVIDEIAI